MPIPGSILNSPILSPELNAALTGTVYSSLADFYSRAPSTQASGQVKYTYTLMGSDHRGIPCRKSPLIQIRPQVQEIVSGGMNRLDARFQLNLSIHLSDIQAEYRVMVDGSLHRIVAVEEDGNFLTSRFMLSDMIPFGE